MIRRSWAQWRPRRNRSHQPARARGSQPGAGRVASWQITPARADEFTARGYKLRHFFPHRVYWLPKCGPDGYKLAHWMCGVGDPQAMWELVLYADDELVRQFPRELFFDDDLIWHQQHFGLPGQVATASLVVERKRVRSITHVSDLVQRISRRREHKTRVEKLFKGWNHMLLNAVLHFALERDASQLLFASSALATRHTDRSRQVDPRMFDRIYDETLRSLFPVRRSGDWWALDVRQARERIVAPYRALDTPRTQKAICIYHDIERGLGQERGDPFFPEGWERALETMLDMERAAGITATYNVVGSLMPEVRHEIEARGGCVAFHSYDHRVERPDQLPRCREVDYRIKGYRPPQSVLTSELTDGNLLFHNFEWLASSSGSLGVDKPELRDGLVRIPVALDDFPMHTGAMQWEDWKRKAVSLVRNHDFVAIGLHDCYARHWLPQYSDFLSRIQGHAELRSMDELAAHVTLQNAA